jgi:2Fe-2S ferredoxin
MTRIIVTSRESVETELEGKTGHSVMETIRDAGLDELLALCGGCCSCATCHVHVDGEYFARLTPMSQDEDDLLESSDHRTAFSRLSCQLQVGSVPNGLRVTIAPED